MRVEKRTYKDGSKKFYLINDDGQTVKTLLIANAKNITKHI